MSAALLTQGIGSWSDTALLVTRGLGAFVVVPPGSIRPRRHLHLSDRAYSMTHATDRALTMAMTAVRAASRTIPTDEEN